MKLIDPHLTWAVTAHSGPCPHMGVLLPALADFPHLATLCVEVLVSRAL